jgi:hypothetical protein
MQKITTLLDETDLISEKKWVENTKQFQPKTETLKNIMKFASTYRVTQIKDNQFVEMFLN